MNDATKKAIRRITVIPGPSADYGSTVEISMKKGNFDLATAFAKWLGEQTGAKVTVLKSVVDPDNPKFVTTSVDKTR